MAIDKRELYETTKALWPTKIDLTTSMYFVDDHYWHLEATVPKDDDWRQLALWAFHQALGVNARRALAAGRSVIFPHRISERTFDKWMLGNLRHESWASELQEYLRTVSAEEATIN